MKKKILALFIASFMIVNVVSAAGLWGAYGGNNIINLTVDGTPVTVTDVPAINYKGRTMIPIYLLQQAGVEYNWSASDQTVDVLTTPYTDPDASKIIALSWVKLYSAYLGELKNLNDLSSYLDILFQIVRGIYISIAGHLDIKMDSDNADQYYASTKKVSDEISTRKTGITKWMADNNIETQTYTKAFDLLNENVTNIGNSLDAVKMYNSNKNKNYFDDYSYYLEKTGRSLIEVKSMIKNEYERYHLKIQNYQ